MNQRRAEPAPPTNIRWRGVTHCPGVQHLVMPPTTSTRMSGARHTPLTRSGFHRVGVTRPRNSLTLSGGDSDGDFLVCAMDPTANPDEVGAPLGLWEGEFESPRRQISTTMAMVS